MSSAYVLRLTLPILQKPVRETPGKAQATKELHPCIGLTDAVTPTCDRSQRNSASGRLSNAVREYHRLKPALTFGACVVRKILSAIVVMRWQYKFYERIPRAGVHRYPLAPLYEPFYAVLRRLQE